jgi:hypothetical protein
MKVTLTKFNMFQLANVDVFLARAQLRGNTPHYMLATILWIPNMAFNNPIFVHISYALHSKTLMTRRILEHE